mgnify:FL=1|tara:strand:- start:321 stop:542 length:222 start_codon:yes stop_codon:yes gene_type:complete
MKFTIINKEDVDSVDFSQILQTSKNTLRYNLAKTKTFVKYNGDQPSFLNGKTEYTKEQISTILSEEEWSLEEN